MTNIKTITPSNMNNYTDIMISNLENLRRGLTNLSLDEFIVNTLEGSMKIERSEYREKAKDPKDFST